MKVGGAIWEVGGATWEVGGATWEASFFNNSGVCLCLCVYVCVSCTLLSAAWDSGMSVALDTRPFSPQVSLSAAGIAR